MSRWFLGGLVAVAIVAGIVVLNLSKGVPVDVAEVTSGEIRTYVEERAKTRLPRIYRISMPLQGRILPIAVAEGAHVSKGDVVARMDTSDLDTDLLSAKTRVAGLDQMVTAVRNSIEASEQTLVAAKAKVNFTQTEFERINRLFESNAGTESAKTAAELRAVESRVELRKDELDDRNYKIGLGVTQLFRQDEFETQAKRQRDRDRATLVSPVDGVVLSRLVSNERVLPAGEILLEIGDLSKLEVEADVLTQDAVRIREQAQVDIAGPAIGDKPITGHVSRIFPQGFTKISSLGVEQQRVKVIIDFAPDDLKRLTAIGRALGADFRVRAKIYTNQKANVTKVPRSAIFRSSSGSWQAFVVRGERLELIDLEIGLANDFEVEVVSGLSAGEQVVLAPESSLSQGQAVEPRKVVLGE